MRAAFYCVIRPTPPLALTFLVSAAVARRRFTRDNPSGIPANDGRIAT